MLRSSVKMMPCLKLKNNAAHFFAIEIEKVNKKRVSRISYKPRIATFYFDLPKPDTGM